jgi:hypothetical protein
MELKDVILSTLAEIDEAAPVNSTQQTITQPSKLVKEEQVEEELEQELQSIEEELAQVDAASDEMLFLSSMRERLLVLFEGFQAPNNTNIEAKIDLTLNFLEYVLVNIDERIKNLEKGSK